MPTEQQIENDQSYLCQAWGETDLPCVAIVTGLAAVEQFLVDQWLGERDATDYSGELTLPAVMGEMQEEWATEGAQWAWTIKFEIGGVSVSKVFDVTPERKAHLAAEEAALTA